MRSSPIKSSIHHSFYNSPILLSMKCPARCQILRWTIISILGSLNKSLNLISLLILQTPFLSTIHCNIFLYPLFIYTVNGTIVIFATRGNFASYFFFSLFFLCHTESNPLFDYVNSYKIIRPMRDSRNEKLWYYLSTDRCS